MTTTNVANTAEAMTDTTEVLEEVAPEVITTFANYGMAWAAYAGLVVLMIAIIWYALRKRHFIINWFISSVILAGALTPGHPAENIETYSPLVLNATVALFDDDSTSFMAGLQTIAIVWAIVFVVGLGLWFGINTYFKKKSSTKSEPVVKSEPELEENTEEKVEPKIEG